VKDASRSSPALSHTQELAASWRRELPGRELSDFLLAIYLMRLGRLLDETYDQMCRTTYKVSGADMRVLFALRRAGAPYMRRPTDLFRSLLVTSGAMTKQVDRLEQRRLVERRPDPAYPGGLLIRLTARGLKVANAATEALAIHSPATPAVSGMNKADRDAIQRLCEHMLIALDKTTVPSAGTEHYGRRGRARAPNLEVTDITLGDDPASKPRRARARAQNGSSAR
jgi:DNA-binding MarR family transcriptional regulator